MNDDPRKKAKRTFAGVRFDVYDLDIENKSGGYSKRQFVDHPGAVVILPILDDKSIVIIRNHRFAVNETLWELPAGTLEPNEHPADTAARELTEETGYTASAIKELGYFYTTPGICNEKMWAFVATGLSHVGQNLDDGEEISVEIASWKEVNRLISSGQIKDGKTLATLLLYNNSN